MRRISAIVLLLALPPVISSAAVRSRRRTASRASNISLRKRLHVSTLIAEPGTGEIDWGGLYSISTAAFSMPTTLRYTPEGHHIAWGRTEYDVGFDSINNSRTDVGRATEFSQSVSLAASSVLYDGEKLDIALAPQATLFLRDESGARLGAVAIARFDTGKSSIGATLGWSGATHSSATNPAGTFDLGLGFGRRFASGGGLGKFTSHVNAIWERSTGQERVISAFEGLEYQMTERVALDLSGQHLSLRGGTPDHQIVLSLAVTFGKAH